MLLGGRFSCSLHLRNLRVVLLAGLPTSLEHEPNGVPGVVERGYGRECGQDGGGAVNGAHAVSLRPGPDRT